MFQNYLAAALRNLVRNRLYAAINIVGLAVGFAAAILIALFVRDEFSYDKWIPGYQNVYRLSAIAERNGQGPVELAQTPAELAPALKLNFPSIQAVARLSQSFGAGLRHAEVESVEPFSFWWADPNFFEVVPLKVYAGDLKTALNRPDGIVMSRTMARKYFGRDDPLGDKIDIDRIHPMVVTALIEDLPSNTHLSMGVVASGLATFSPLSMMVKQPPGVLGTHTYLRLNPGASPDDLRRALPAFLDRYAPPRIATAGAGRTTLLLYPISSLHLRPNIALSMRSIPGDLATIAALSVIGILIVFLASINFVNLMTARATRRAIEVGIRKVTGADRRNLAIQFIGESLIYVGLGLAFAIIFSDLLLPAFNAFLDRTIIFDLRDPMFVGGIIASGLLIGVSAGLYPAIVLSAFQPVFVLKGGQVQAAGSSIIRQTLVIAQFAILIGLIVCTAILQRQTDFALNNGMRRNTDAILQVGMRTQGKCDGVLKDRIAALPGVRGAACSLTNLGAGPATKASDINGTQIDAFALPIDFGYLELYGLRPLAGRFFSKTYGTDAAGAAPDAPEPPIVINETMMRRLGFASPEEATGKSVSWKRYLSPTPNGIAPSMRPAEIIGVTPDFPTDTVRRPVAPVIFWVAPQLVSIVSVKLMGQDIPETLHAIEGLWKQFGEPNAGAINFVDQILQANFADITRESQLFAAFSGVAVFIACLGLFGLSAFTAERRTREIGIRKAMGARRLDIVRMLVWQFAKPVLWANLIAWPVAYYFMNRWLHGFAYHVELSPWLFFAAGGGALAIAIATVAAHSYAASAAPPIMALRHE